MVEHRVHIAGVIGSSPIRTTTNPPHWRRIFLYAENPTLGVGFSKAYSYGDDRKTPFA